MTDDDPADTSVGGPELRRAWHRGQWIEVPAETAPEWDGDVWHDDPPR
ncbi:hypothetical protein [Jongsikchunia kroppenstedtii]|nr:hypothetical protein [Jongsikchunia kroppenstedtii]